MRRLLAGTTAAVAAAIAVARAPRRRVDAVAMFTDLPVAVVGHRGAAGHAPENTLLAFEQGLRLGADAVEFDVRLSRDGHVVVMHDPTVDRTTDGSGPVAAHTLADLRKLDAGYRWRGADGRYPYRGKSIGIPTLGEVFDALPNARCVIELKPEAGTALVSAVAEEVERADRHDRVLLASADPTLLREARRLLPSVPTNLGEDEARRFYGLQLLGCERRWWGSGQIIQVPETHRGRGIVTPRFVAAAHDIGLDVQVWTVNDVDDMRRLVDWGVDGLISDYPDRALEAARAAGLAVAPQDEADP